MFKKRAARPYGIWPAAVCFFADTAFAHSFYDRYDLPIPLSYFLWGSAAVVTLTFALMLVLPKRIPSFLRTNSSFPCRRESTNAWIPAYAGITRLWFQSTIRVLALGLFVLTIDAALFGTANPLMNLAPSLVWVTWWVGLSLLIAACGNVWPWLDPWRTLWGGLAKLGLKPLNRTWPVAWGMCPAVFFLLAWSWLEVVFPIAVIPRDLGILALAWTIISLLGMWIFNPEVWRAHADFVVIYFSLIAKIGLQATSFKASTSTLHETRGYVSFILAMLSTVLFDGLHGHPVWLFLEGSVLSVLPNWLANLPYFSGTLGLVTVWLIFMASYKFTTREHANAFAPSLIPIAVAYLVAHNFSNLVVQGQSVIFLLSDPLGTGWNLFGSADFKPNSDIINAKFTWYLAVSSIVLGHVAAVVISHRAAMRLSSSSKQAAWLCLPYTALMIAYTLLSLLIIAEPLVGGA
jgi:hypothetical protein